MSALVGKRVRVEAWATPCRDDAWEGTVQAVGYNAGGQAFALLVEDDEGELFDVPHTEVTVIERDREGRPPVKLPGGGS